jgi:murein DD-endopeptidase MepM/ murein hydrolase activator NlpD
MLISNGVKRIITVIALLIIVAALAVYFKRKSSNIFVKTPVPVQQETPVSQEKKAVTQPDSQTKPTTGGFVSPLDRASERVTKKPFGIFITPQTSPVQPEHFRGYHTGTDFEIFPGEENIDVSIKAVCSGKILVKKTATGYGGVAVESCNLNNEPITVVYGHLKLGSVIYNPGDKINAGDTLGILGKGYSAETSGERKHLHLGFHTGAAINILGYVQSQGELAGWLDPCLYVCGN